MKALIRGLVFLSTVFAACAPCEGVVVRGRVVGPDGSPAAQAPVWMLGPHGVASSTTTDSRGAFQFADAPRGAFTIATEPVGAGVVWKTLEEPVGVAVELIARRSAAVGGVVINGDGRAVPGATVRVDSIVPRSIYGAMFYPSAVLDQADRLPGMTTKTDGAGAFAIDGIPEGFVPRYTVTAPHLAVVADYASATAYYVFLPGSGEWVPSPCGSGPAVIQMGPSATLEGRVSIDGKGAPHAKVEIESEFSFQPKQVTSDQDGRYVAEVAPGTYSIWAESGEDLQSKEVTCSLHSRQVAAVDLEPAPVPVIAGKVPLEGVPATHWTLSMTWQDTKIAATGAAQAVPIKPDGSFSARAYAGLWTVKASSDVGEASCVILVRAGDRREEAEWQRRPSSNVPVTISDASGRPVPGAFVAGERSQVADERGEVRVTADTEQRLYAASPDLKLFGAGILDVGARELKIWLVPGVHVSGRVLDESGKPLAGASCTVEVKTVIYPGGYTSMNYPVWFSVATDEGGRYALCLPAAAKYSLVIEKAGWSVARTAVAEVPSDKAGDVADVALAPLDRTAKGVVVDKDGKPLAGASVVARWEPLKGAGAVAERVAFADPNGSFSMTELPRATDVAFAVRDTERYGDAGSPSAGTEWSDLKLLAWRKPASIPERFASGTSLFSEGSVDWIQGEAPSTGKRDLSILFATAYDPACERAARAGTADAAVFDAALPVDMLKAYVAGLGIACPVGRVRDGQSLGWGGEGPFKGFEVPCVPSRGSIDASGTPHPAQAEAPGGRPQGSSAHPLLYRAVSDWSIANFGAQAEKASGRYDLPHGVENARFYEFRWTTVPCRLAVGERASSPVVVMDVMGRGDLADMTVFPLQVGPQNSGSVVVPFAVDGTFLGDYTVTVSAIKTPNEIVQIRSVGSKVGEVEFNGKTWRCEIWDCDTRLGFSPGDKATLTSGSDVLNLTVGDWYIEGETAYRLTVDPFGRRVSVEPPPLYLDLKYAADELVISGNAYGGRWAALGEAGAVRLPRDLTQIRATFSRKGAGGAWTAEFSGDGLPSGAERLDASPIDCSLAVKSRGAAWAIEASFKSASGLALETVRDPAQKEAEVLVEFLDAHGVGLGAVKPARRRPGVWSAEAPAPSGAASVRLKVDFGPFKVKPAVVTIP